MRLCCPISRRIRAGRDILLENPFYVAPVELLTRLREKDAEQVRIRELEAAGRIQRGLMGMDTCRSVGVASALGGPSPFL